MLQDLQARDHAVAAEAIEGLRDRAPAIRDELLTMLAQGDYRTRWRAAELLGFAGGAAVREALIGVLDDPYADVRLNAARSLARLRARDAAGRIAMMATDPDEELPVRLAAVDALRMLAAADQLDALLRLIEDRPPIPPVGEEAGASTAEDAAADTSEEEPPPDETGLLRVAAVRAVAVVGAAAILRGTASPSEPSPVEDAEAEPETEAESPASRVLSVVIASTDPQHEPNPNVRQAACYALGDLLELSADRAGVANGVRALVNALKDEVSEVRIAAAHTLNIITVPPEDLQMVQEALAQAANDDHYWVRQAALEAMAGG